VDVGEIGRQDIALGFDVARDARGTATVIDREHGSDRRLGLILIHLRFPIQVASRACS